MSWAMNFLLLMLSVQVFAMTAFALRGVKINGVADFIGLLCFCINSALIVALIWMHP
jgi:hypothetical protein